MSLSARIIRADIGDPDPTSALVRADVTYLVSTDNVEALAAGAGQRTYTLRCEIARADIPALQAALGAALRVVDDGGWPTAALPLPLARKAP